MHREFKWLKIQLTPILPHPCIARATRRPYAECKPLGMPKQTYVLHGQIWAAVLFWGVDLCHQHVDPSGRDHLCPTPHDDPNLSSWKFPRLALFSSQHHPFCHSKHKIRLNVKVLPLLWKQAIIITTQVFSGPAGLYLTYWHTSKPFSVLLVPKMKSSW